MPANTAPIFPLVAETSWVSGTAATAGTPGLAANTTTDLTAGTIYGPIITGGTNGTRVDFKDPEIHGNPVDQTGSIVTVDWGYDLHQLFAECGPFDVRVARFADRTHGVLGEYTDVVTCRKPR